MHCRAKAQGDRAGRSSSVLKIVAVLEADWIYTRK